MSDWRPTSGPAAAARRAAMLERARAWFRDRDVLSVDTPALSRFAATDPNIDSLSAKSRHGSAWFLHTSPEFCMKRLLAAGYPDIYSICRVFRDGESGKRHCPEFTMIEWYRIGYGLAEIVADTTGLITACLDREALDVVSHDYAAAFRTYARLDPFTATMDELADCAGADGRLRREIGDERDDWLDLILSSQLVPKFDEDKLTVLRHYPASQAALARLCPADGRVADRFEVFLGAVELANGYVELTDADEQRLRMDRELEMRQRKGRPEYPWDRGLIAALQAGLPDCAGVAVGLERLQMIADRVEDIADVVTFVPDHA